MNRATDLAVEALREKGITCEYHEPTSGPGECSQCDDVLAESVALVRPIIEAGVRNSIRRRYETNTCACGHDRTAHHSWDLGDCADCPHGTCLAPYNEGLLWDRRHGLRDEVEVRERIAAEIEAERDGEPAMTRDDRAHDEGMTDAARIARRQS